MNLANIRKILQHDWLLLLPILGLAFYIAYIPHLQYPYPSHVDEWVHIAHSNAILQSESATYIDPFSGEGEIGLGSNLEASFQRFWGIFQAISGLSWITIYKYFPAAIFMITVLSVYIMARREGFGIEAAFFTCLIPTTVGILGPGFLVPVTTGLIFTPLVLFLAFNFRGLRSYLLLFIVTCFLLAIHAPSAIIPIIVLAPYILLNLKSNFKHSLGIALAMILPFLIVFPWIFDLLLPTARGLFTPQSPTEYVQLPRLVRVYGYYPIGFTLLGTFLLALKGGRKNYGLLLGLLALLLMLVTFYTFHYGVPIVYERGLMYMMLMTGIVAGAGLAGIKKLRLPSRIGNRITIPAITRNIGILLWLGIIVTTLFVSIPERLDTPYYHMIDREDYRAFTWIRDNIGEDYHKAILDPWKATAFTAITGKNIHTRIHTAPTSQDTETYAFIAEGSSNTTFLRDNGISVIYTRVYDRGQTKDIEYGIDNPDLIKVASNTYLLKEAATEE